MNLESAYQGKGWKPRTAPAASDMNGSLWADARVNSECLDLRAVMLYIPGRELNSIRSPKAVQHLRKVNRAKLASELRALAGVYRKHGVKVHWLESSRLPKSLGKVPPNLVFVRDLFFNTTQGALIARMASQVRAGEEKFAAAELAAAGVPIRMSAGGRAVFEGADALWLDPKTVMIGIGNRTNALAAKQIAAVLKEDGVRTIAVKMPKGVQHLLGVLQIIDRKFAAVRSEKAPHIAKRLKALGFKLINVSESEEVTGRLGMNFVTLRPREIVMAANCPSLRRQLEDSGVRVLAALEISQLINAAGGIACATGILARRIAP